MARKKNGTNLPRVVSREDRRMIDQLPSYFHNMNSRVGLDQTTEKSHRLTKQSKQNFIDKPSTLNDKKKSFRIDPDLPIGEQQYDEGNPDN